MAFVARRPHGNALVAKVRDESGRWRNRDIVALGHAESPQAALLAFGDELLAIQREIDSWADWQRRQFRYRFRALTDRRDELQRRISVLTDWLRTEGDA